MLSLSEIISRPVISLYEGVRAGYINNVVLSERSARIEGFVVYEDDTENLGLYLDCKNIFKMGPDAVLIKNLQKLEPKPMQINSPINKSVYSFSGVFFGNVTDIIVNEDLAVVSLKTSSGKEVDICSIVNQGDSVILFTEEESQIKIASMKPKDKIKKQGTYLDDLKVSIMEFSDPENIMTTEKRAEIILPAKISGSSSFLLGRKAAKTIIGMNNEIVIKKGQTINEKNLSVIKQHNKINELVHNTIV